MTADLRPTLEAPGDDPYLWLEEIEGDCALGWVNAQSAATLQRFGGPIFERDRDTLAGIFDRPDNIPYIVRRGQFVYNFWTDEKNPRGLWRRTTLADYRTGAAAWDVLLDLDKLADAEGKDWTWGGASTVPSTHDHAIVRLSLGGSDAVEMREFDLHTHAFVANGFCVPLAKGGKVWLDKDTLLLYSAIGEGMATNAGYSRTVRLWRRGTALEDAAVIFETDVSHIAASAYCDRSAGSERIFFFESPSFFETNVHIGTRGGPLQELDVPADAWTSISGDWIAIKLRTPWTVEGQVFPGDTLLGASLSRLLAGEKEFAILFHPGPKLVLQGMQWAGGSLLISILDDLKPRHDRATPSTGGWTVSQVEGLPDTGEASVWRLDMEQEESNGDLLALVQDPLTPPQLFLMPSGKAPELLRRAPQTFGAEGLSVSRHDAISTDGERIPYFQIGPTEPAGNAPVHLTGYGGFAVPSLPCYNSAIGKLWLERGGTHVVANIRGGGEYGTRWHDAGRREGKIKSHDDFAAVAADLVERGVTSPSRIAAQGGSNGGILITNMLIRYPERFGALFCTIPLVDMYRYTKLLAGASWVAEYGDPEKPEDWAFLQKYSAFHNVEAGRVYPPILLATTRRDDRVHPGHARKMAAKLQALRYDAYFYEPAAGGHGYGKDNKERAAFISLGYNFLREAIGWRPDKS